MNGPGRIAAALVLALAPGPAAGAPAAKQKRPTPTPTPIVYQGPPAPTPEPLRRAAGSCVRYEPGRFLILAEVGQSGQIFRIDSDTETTTTPKTGARVRVVYVEGADGPIARKILPGPTEGAATPKP